MVGGKPLVFSSATGGTTALALNDFKVASTGARPVVQRSALSMGDPTPWADVQIFFSFTGNAPTSVHARVVQANSPNTAVAGMDWRDLENLTITTQTTGFGWIRKVPQGCYYLTNIRDGNQIGNPSTTSLGTVKWGVGVIVAALGQSNMIQTLDAGYFTDPIPGIGTQEFTYAQNQTAPVSWFGNSGWYLYGNGAHPGHLSFVRKLASALKTKYGNDVPVALVPWAIANQKIETFLLPSGANTAIFSNSAETGAVGFKSPFTAWSGDLEVVTWHQGEANATVTSIDGYADLLRQLYQQFLDLTVARGRTAANLHFLPAMIGSYGGTEKIEEMRAAVLKFVDTVAPANNWPRVKLGWTTIDCDPSDPNDGYPADTLHFHDVQNGGNQYQKWSLDRMEQSVFNALGCSTYGGAGPRLTGTYTRADVVVTLDVQHDGGTTLSGRAAGAVYGFTANTLADFSGTDVVPSAIINGAGKPELTFPAGTPFPLYIKYMGGKVGTTQSTHPDLTNPVYDNTEQPCVKDTGGVNVFTGADVARKMDGSALGAPLLPTPNSIKVS